MITKVGCQKLLGRGYTSTYQKKHALRRTMMAKTVKGKKKVHVPAHEKKGKNGKRIKIREHYRSTPN